MTLAEPAVPLTDFGLAIECALFVWLLSPRAGASSGQGRWFRVFFASTGLAAFLGGVVHGFLTDSSSRAHAALWTATLIASGVSALAIWMIGAELVDRPYAREIRRIALAAFTAYLAVIVVQNTFVIAIIAFLPAVLFLLIVFGWRYRRRRETAALWGIAGLLLMLLGAAVQRAGSGRLPDWFNHNAVFHVIQALALACLFAAAGRFGQPARRHPTSPVVAR